jgi:hypothetical protein
MKVRLSYNIIDLFGFGPDTCIHIRGRSIVAEHKQESPPRGDLGGYQISRGLFALRDQTTERMGSKLRQTVSHLHRHIPLITGREREQGIKTKMRVKVAAKILVIAWTLWKRGEMFQGEYLLR